MRQVGEQLYATAAISVCAPGGKGAEKSVDTETVWHREGQFLEISVNSRTETSTRTKQRHGDKGNLYSKLVGLFLFPWPRLPGCVYHQKVVVESAANNTPREPAPGNPAGRRERSNSPRTPLPDYWQRMHLPPDGVRSPLAAECCNTSGMEDAWHDDLRRGRIRLWQASVENFLFLAWRNELHRRWIVSFAGRCRKKQQSPRKTASAVTTRSV